MRKDYSLTGRMINAVTGRIVRGEGKLAKVVGPSRLTEVLLEHPSGAQSSVDFSKFVERYGFATPKEVRLYKERQNQ